MLIDFNEFMQVFNNWAIANQESAEQWYCIDGKTLRVSQTYREESYEQFVQIVSVFSIKTGIVRGMSSWLSKDDSEILIVQIWLCLT